MCGVAGFVGFDRPGGWDPRAVVEKMTGRVAHRGPDAQGIWLDADAGVALGHRRLSIVDLSDAGAQPMASKDGRWVVAYNGEIYNHAELSRDLVRAGAASFRGHSDTEALVEGLSHWGLEKTIQRCVGMFAIAAWDRRDRRLYLVRDRLGIKPLYWARFGASFVFGSELSALRDHPRFESDLDPSALAAYFEYCNIPAPLSIFRNVKKLEPATVLSVDASSLKMQSSRFWSAARFAESGQRNQFAGSYEDALVELKRLLSDAVGLRMLADVPLGAFLSGGIDSSLVVALMQDQSSRPVKTFTIGSTDSTFDESPHARAIASALGTDHTELMVSPAEAQAVIPLLPRIYDEPFSDSSMIPTFIVSRLARTTVTVSLSGDGGDEVFGGYNRHLWAPRLWKFGESVPRFLRHLLGSRIHAVPPATWDRLLSPLMSYVPSRFRFIFPGDKMHKIGAALSASAPRELYASLARSRGSNVLLEPPEAREDPWSSASAPESLGFVEQMMLLDLITYLPDDILTKVDRASMAVALEARVPLIDHRVVEFAWTLPTNFRIRNGVTKAPLRDLLGQFVPRHLFERPKSGFGIPVGDWVRGPMREWAEALLSPKKIRDGGILHPARVQALWQGHLDGKTNTAPAVWSVLMLQAWLEGAEGARWS